jgi:hypothetical protein
MVEANNKKDATVEDQSEDLEIPKEHDPVYRGLFPSRNTFTFSKSPILITSEFEGGNLLRCEEKTEFEPLPRPDAKKKTKKKEESKNTSDKGSESSEEEPEDLIEEPT